MIEIEPKEFLYVLGICLGISGVLGASIPITQETISEYISQRRLYREPQLLLFPELYKPSLGKILKQEIKETFSFKKKKRLEDI